MRDKCFIDSNIFLYAFSTKDEVKQQKAKEIVLSLASISTQVINEVCVNMIKKLKLEEDQVAGFILSSYNRYEVIELTKDIFFGASTLRVKYQFSYYDSLIVSAALDGECDILYTEDMQHKQLIENRLQIVNPFSV